MKKPIFILTYNEGQHWCENYPAEKYSTIFTDPDYQLIFLDNGNQDLIKEWCEKTNSIYFASENNIGTTGGYNWFIKVGRLLKASRIAVMQSDIHVKDPIVFELLFRDAKGGQYKPDEFTFWPWGPKKYWSKNGQEGDVGQFFSLDPKFFLDNDFLCDENYTVTHFESTDLYIRMVEPHQNLNFVKPINLYYDNFLDGDGPIYDEVNHIMENELYNIYSYTNREGLHDKWFEYNWEYFCKKWLRGLDVPFERGFFLKNKMGSSIWMGPVWIDNVKKVEYQKLLLHRMPLDVHRNINVGQLPYPVEYEINRFYKEIILTGTCIIGNYE